MLLAGRSATRPSARAPEEAPDDWDNADWAAQRMVVDAGAHAARLRRQASVQTATICAAAQREAEMILRQASAQAAAIRDAGERDAEQLRATVTKLSAAPGGQAAADLGPVRRAQGPPRQLAAVRVAAAATAALLLFALASATTEVALHGFSFFIFRSAGTGETRGSGLQEDQGPGQPDAPRPAPRHIHVRLNNG
jgi:hypothetical protein